MIADSFSGYFPSCHEAGGAIDNAHYNFLDRDHFGIERDRRVLSGEKGGFYLAGFVAQVGEVERGLAERIGQREPELPVCIGDAAD